MTDIDHDSNRSGRRSKADGCRRRAYSRLLFTVLLLPSVLLACNRQHVRTTTFGDGTPWTRIHLSDGVLDGVAETWYSNGKRRSEGAYSNGIPVGRWRTWFRDGKPKAVSQYLLGVPDGLWLLYNEAGVQTGAERYSNGLLSGERKLWADNGDPLIVENCRNGRKQGLRVFFRENRSVRLEETFDAGVKNGLSRSWNEQGKLIEVVHWKDDRTHGRQALFLPDGTKLAEGQNVLGQREGAWFVFFEDGQLRPRAGLYQAGKRVADLPPEEASRAEEVFHARAPEDLAPPSIVASDVLPE